MTTDTAGLIREVSGHLQFNLDAYGKVWTGEDEDTAFICRPLLNEIKRLREALTRIADYDVRVTAGASDAYVIQDIAREAVGWSEALEAGER